MSNAIAFAKPARRATSAAPTAPAAGPETSDERRMRRRLVHRRDAAGRAHHERLGQAGLAPQPRRAPADSAPAPGRGRRPRPSSTRARTRETRARPRATRRRARPGCRRRSSSATARSCSGWRYECRRQTATASRVEVRQRARGRAARARRPAPSARARRHTARAARAARGVRAQPIEMRARLPPQVQQVLEARRADERRARAAAFEQGVRRDRRAVAEALDRVGAHRTRRGDAPTPPAAARSGPSPCATRRRRAARRP